MIWPLLVPLISFLPYVHCISLTSSPAEVRPPGASVKLSCQISGYSLTSYGTSWIRQHPGKALEWIAVIWAGGSINTGASFQSRFSISRDTSSNVLYLDISGLVTQDTAVYYCAKDTQLFTSERGCGYSSDGSVTLGCVTYGLPSADDLIFSWTDQNGKSLTDFVQYPAMNTDKGYTSVSQLRVQASDWNAKKQFKCQAKNSKGDLEATLKKPEGLVERPPTVLLTASSQTELDNETTTFICLAERYAPKNVEFNWTVGDDSTHKARHTIESKDNSGYTAISVLEISTSSWMSYPVTCAVSHKTGTVKKDIKYVCSGAQSPKPKIIPPSAEDMLINKVGDLKCMTNGAIGFTSIKWLIEGKEVSSFEKETASDDTFLSLKTKINFDDWSTGTKFTCEVKHPTYVHETETVSFQRVNGKKQSPKLYVLAPPESSEDLVTLTCYVKDFLPKELVVSWLVGDKLAEVSKQNTSSVIEKDGLFSAYSKLTIENSNWKSGIIYTCRVYHEAIDRSVHLISRSINSNPDPPTIMNLNVTVPMDCNASAF
ncbi:Ig mu chain C region membrane-bound form [Bagarius yarrelli]|uniref:Ig mu chain C region membrane-bound form n=1 Tax=Bagarius yarrelli TaxID=175774 RepID=A0A556TVK5_BAGYA|nr:Ig mu chain C region membrane-bound form [Bagarius yarrelli]